MKYIKLTQGYITKVDDEDFEYLNQFKWQYRSGYATRSVYHEKGNYIIQMHRLVNDTPEKMFTDHINGDKLDNRKSNLRNCTDQTNAINHPKHPKTRYGKPTSKYKGVCRFTGSNLWRAYIRDNGKLITLGKFLEEKDAALAYDEAAKRFHGEFARLNFPSL